MHQLLATTRKTRYSILISLLINKYILLSVILSTERTQGRKGKWTVRPFSRNPESNPSLKEKSCAQKEKSPADHRGRRGLETMESQTFLSQKQVPSKAADRLNFAAGILAWGWESPLKGKNFRMPDVAGIKQWQWFARRKIRAGGLEIFLWDAQHHWQRDLGRI